MEDESKSNQEPNKAEAKRNEAKQERDKAEAKRDKAKEERNEAKQERDKAEAKRDKAKEELEKNKSNLDLKERAKRMFDSAQNALENAEEALKSAQKVLDNAEAALESAQKVLDNAEEAFHNVSASEQRKTLKTVQDIEKFLSDFEQNSDDATLRKRFSRNSNYRTASNFAECTFQREKITDIFSPILSTPKVGDRSPLYGIIASPGEGKSHFFDEAVRLNKRSRFRQTMKKNNKILIPLLVTLNSKTEIQPEEKDKSPILLVACRILFYFYDFKKDATTAFQNFVEYFYSFNWSEKGLLINCLRVLVEFYQKNEPTQETENTEETKKSPVILFAIDEFKNFGASDSYELILAKLKGIADTKLFDCRVFISTLDYDDVVKALNVKTATPTSMQTGSSRIIYWLRIPQFDEKDVFRYFSGKYGSLIDCQLLEYFISLTACHPRTLELLDVAFTRHNFSFSQILESFSQNSVMIQPNLELRVLKSVLAHSILSQPVTVHSGIPYTEFKYGDLIHTNILANVLVGDETFVPTLRIISLLPWISKQMFTDENDRLIFTAFRTVCQEGHQMSSENPIAYEHFVANLESLRLWAASYLKMNNITYKVWCGGKVVKDDSKILSKTVSIPSSFPAVRDLEKEFSKLPQLPLQGVFKTAPNNPGFDVFVPLGDVTRIVECRFSDVTTESNTLDKNVDLWQKIYQTQKQIANTSFENKIFVLCALRSTSSDLDSFIQSTSQAPKNENESQQKEESQQTKKKKKPTSLNYFQSFTKFDGAVVVMDRKLVCEWAGPTFQMLAGFLLDVRSRSPNKSNPSTQKRPLENEKEEENPPKKARQ